MTDRELMQQALEALVQIHPGNMTPMAEEGWNKAIASLGERLAQPYCDDCGGTDPECPLAQPEQYREVNPLGGPAKVFDAMADAIRAGDSYESVLRQYRYTEAQSKYCKYPSCNCNPNLYTMNECKRQTKPTPLDRMADNARELGLDYEPEQGLVAWCQLTTAGGIAYFDGKPMVMVGKVGNEMHPAPLYTHPLNLQDKSVQARLATLWGYEKKVQMRRATREEKIDKPGAYWVPDTKVNSEAIPEQISEPEALEAVYETIIDWDERGGKRSRRELARRIVALYTAPPRREWVGLTDQEMNQITVEQWGEMKGPPLAAHRAYARAIEAKLKEKNA